MRPLLPVLLLAAVAAAQGDREGQGLTREQMWPAPTAEDWAKPCLITWQRTWKDALTVSKETGKPILICINMDGEIASEHYAGVRYRQPEVAALYKEYVCVVASVYRHNPRDHDDQGRRIPCPRFGTVTCGEHIWIEPTIYEKFCDGRRIAPRHICVSLEGEEVYDVMLTNDTASVFDAVREGRKELPPAKAPVVRGDRPIVERVASRDVRDRRAVEKAYADGDKETRQALLEAALKHEQAEQLDLLRLAIFGMDVDASRAARKALARVETPDAAALISDAMAVPMETVQRDALIAALKRLGETSPRARWLAGVHQGLTASSAAVDASGWKSGGEYPAPTAGIYGGDLLSSLESRAKQASENPEDGGARLEVAEASLALALKAPQVYATNPRMARLAARHLFEDAQQLAREAAEFGETSWRTHAVEALAAYYSGDREKGYGPAETAVKALPKGDTSWASMAVVTIFAESRWKAIKAAVRKNEDWPPGWLADLHGAYSVLMRHPLGTDGQVLWHYELLDWLGIRHRAARVLREGLARFTDSAKLHEQMRKRLLKFRGPGALEEEYDRLLKEHGDAIVPFAGRAAVAAAEQYRRARAYEKALLAYERAVAYHERAIQTNAADRDRAIALALAGSARVAFQLGDDDLALKSILRSFERSPDSAGTLDGMGITPGETAQVLLARLREKKREDAARSLADALSRLDPELLRPDRGLQGG